MATWVIPENIRPHPLQPSGFRALYRRIAENDCHEALKSGH